MFRRSFLKTALVFSSALAMPDAESQENGVTLGLIGDSTVASEYGWGPAFAGEVNESAKVLNFAKNGATLDSLSEQLEVLIGQTPDYILIQFGHNDMKRYDADVYGEKLKDYVERIRQGGSKAIIVSSVTRRNFDTHDKISPRIIEGRTLSDYAVMAQAIAEELKVPFIPLYSISLDHHNAIGPAASAAYNFVETDTTHFSEAGAQAIADLIIEELKGVVPELAKHLK